MPLAEPVLGRSGRRRRAEPPVTQIHDQAAMTKASYAAAGVDIDAGDRAVELMKAKLSHATRPEVVGGIGGFAGLFRLGKYRDPLLASSTDGVGTKLAIAQAMDKHDTVGIDLVGMVVDDLVVCGAEPLFMQDYIAVGRVVPERIAEIVGGIADGCTLAGCALVGGETAEHPGRHARRPLRHRRHRRGRRRGGPGAGRRPGRRGRRRHRDGVLGGALQRLLAGAARAAGRRPDAAGRRGRRARHHPRARSC